MPASAIAPSDFTLLSEVIASVARSSRLPTEDAEDFAQHAHLRLLERNYAPLTRFAGQSSLRTFLTVVVKRLLLDWRSSRYGKWRPSTAARRLGPTAVDLERLISRDGHPEDEAMAIIGAQSGALTPTMLRAIAAQLPRRCRIQTVVPDNLEALSVGGFDDPIEQAEARAAQRETLRRLREARGSLPQDDRRLLCLRFQRKMSIPDIAALLDTPAKPLYRRVDAVLTSLRRALRQVDGNGVGYDGTRERRGCPHAARRTAPTSLRTGRRTYPKRSTARSAR